MLLLLHPTPHRFIVNPLWWCTELKRLKDVTLQILWDLRVPPVSPDFTFPDANIYSVKWAVCDMTTSATRTTVLFCFLSVWVTPGCEEPSAFVTANQTKWGGGREDCSRCVLWGFFRSASNLYATRVMGIPRETIPLVSETMQNATLIPTDFSVKCSASQAIELGAQSLVFQHPRPRVQNHPQTLSRDFFSLQLTGSHCHRRSWHNEPNQTTKILQVSLPPLLSRTMNTGYSQRWLCVDTCSREKNWTFGRSGKETPVFSEQFFHWGRGRHCMWWNSALVLEWFNMSSCSAVSLCLPVSLQSVGRCCQTRWPSYILSGFVFFFLSQCPCLQSSSLVGRPNEWARTRWKEYSCLLL